MWIFVFWDDKFYYSFSTHTPEGKGNIIIQVANRKELAPTRYSFILLWHLGKERKDWGQGGGYHSAE